MRYFRLLCFLLYSKISAQTITKMEVRGVVLDSNAVALPSASIILMNQRDSTMISYTRSDEKGAFLLKNVKNQAVFLRISYVGYAPLDKSIVLGNEAVINLDTIRLKAIEKTLFEVVIKAARAPMTIRGDTIEFNAAAFKVPPGSTVEDLLKKIPGFRIDAAGNINAQGKNVKKVLVNKKDFFGNDPKIATQNIDAEAIEKVQLFDDKSDKTKQTGIDDGEKIKTVNLELKDEYKNGQFGKLTAGLGSKQRQIAKGLYNRFSDNHQFSAIGSLNNINQSTLAGQDHSEFSGNAVYEKNGGLSQHDNIYDPDQALGSNNDADYSSVGIGLNRNAKSGINYNYNTKKTKLTSRYMYQSNSSEGYQSSEQKSFFEQKFLQEYSNTNWKNAYGNHDFLINVEKELDSLNFLYFSVSKELTKTKKNNINDQNTFSDSELSNTLNSVDVSKYKHNLLMLNATYQHKFKKKGRNFAMTVAHTNVQNDGNLEQQNNSQFFVANNGTVYKPTQQSIFYANGLNHKALEWGAYYQERLGKRFSVNFSGKTSKKTTQTSTDAFDKNMLLNNRIDSLSIFFDNTLSLSNIASDLKYNFKGTVISAKMTRSFVDRPMSFTRNRLTMLPSAIDQKYDFWLPSLSFNIDMGKSSSMNASVSKSVYLPSFDQLKPFITQNNPLYIFEGNPDLLPSVSQHFSIGYHYYNNSNQISVSFYSNYMMAENDISSSQTIDYKTFTTRIKPINVSGRNYQSTNFSLSFPLKVSVTDFDLNFYTSSSKNIGYINDIANNNFSRSYDLNTSINLNLSDWLSSNLRVSKNRTFNSFSMNTTENQVSNQFDINTNIKAKFSKKVYFSTDFSLQKYSNERFGLNQTLPIWQASCSVLLGKNNKSELKLVGYDLLNKNVGISQFTGTNSYSQSQSQALARYFMLNYSYNIRGIVKNIRY